MTTDQHRRKVDRFMNAAVQDSSDQTSSSNCPLDELAIPQQLKMSLYGRRQRSLSMMATQLFELLEILMIAHGWSEATVVSDHTMLRCRKLVVSCVMSSAYPTHR